MLRQTGFRQKADERILRDGDFVASVLRQAGEQLERKYRLKASGCDLKKIVLRVAALLEMTSDQVVSASKCRRSVIARSMVCFRAFTEIGLSQIELAKIFGVSQPAICAAAQKGQAIVKEKRYQLMID
ncbi:MAG: hypothetical protein C4519_23880 [Desulfobacteraceae bacterium]|nr:MAG: hypothetical protein C4519_23880 [Desulfobacteraceae bacterium]